MKKRTVIAAGVIFAGAFLFGVAGYVLSTPIREVFGAPRITVINRTGEPIHDITIILGSTVTEMKPLDENRFRTIKIRKNFPESATTVRWSDSEGVLDSEYLQIANKAVVVTSLTRRTTL